MPKLPSQVSRTLDLVVSLTLLVAGAVLFAMTFGEQFGVPTFGGDIGPAVVPRGFLLVWMALALAATISAMRSQGRPIAALNVRQLVLVALIAAGTGYGMTKVGFVPASVPGFFLFCYVFGYRKLLPLAALSLIAPIAIWALFTFVFELLLPRSPWFNLL